MKAYGTKPMDKISCRYGCCQTNGSRFLRARWIHQRAFRKRARQNARREIAESLDS